MCLRYTYTRANIMSQSELASDILHKTNTEWLNYNKKIEYTTNVWKEEIVTHEIKSPQWKKKLQSGSLILGVLVLAQINLSNKESY